MWLAYCIATIPLLVGGFLFFKFKSIHIAEWLGASVIAYLTAIIFHAISLHGMTQDIETWSGKIIKGQHFAAWREKYDEAVYRNETYYTGSGKNRTSHTRRVFSHYRTAYSNHPEKYVLYSNIDTRYDVSKQYFYETADKFGGFSAIAGDRKTSKRSSKMVGGDPNDYVTFPQNGYVLPITTAKSFENKIKAAPSVFSFVKVPENMTGIYDWPENPNPFVSQRVMGEAKNAISVLEWDRLNAILGPIRFVNLIIIGFKEDSSIANWQEAKWIGGKKNDLVICYGPNGSNNWVKVFGWTEQEICKKNIESIIITNKVDDAIIPLIQKEVLKSYIMKDWSKFDYISVEPHPWTFWILIGVMILSQALLYFLFHTNELEK